tara:strand:- start:4542 stop:5204 length:663 start_codon:yes stop_codon:yes gene_type:complete
MNQVLFWSKYSPHCKKLIDLMNQLNANITKCCIDNNDMRKRLATDTRIKIKVVPTILSIYDNGVIEKYEGEKAFDLLYEAFPPPTRKSSSIVKYSTPKKKTQPTPIHIKQESNDIHATIPPPPKSIDSPSLQSTHALENSSSSMTSIDDLGDEELFTSSSPTESGLSGNTGDYEREDPPANLPVKAKSNLSSIAADIAKNRDMMDSSIPRPTRNNIAPTI